MLIAPQVPALHLRRYGYPSILFLSLIIGLSSFASSWLFVEAHSPLMTRARKREIVAGDLPWSVILLTVISLFALVIGAHRAGGLRGLLWRGSAPWTERLVRAVVAAMVIGLATPLGQVLLGVPTSAGPSRLLAEPMRAATATIALLACALQEEVVVRVLVIEAALLLGAPWTRANRSQNCVWFLSAVASVCVAFYFHAFQGSEPWGFPAIALGLSKVPAAATFSWMYLRLGLCEVALAHGLSNLVILALVPALAGAGAQ